jgi:hypothetical protein
MARSIVPLVFRHKSTYDANVRTHGYDYSTDMQTCLQLFTRKTRHQVAGISSSVVASTMVLASVSESDPNAFHAIYGRSFIPKALTRRWS